MEKPSEACFRIFRYRWRTRGVLRKDCDLNRNYEYHRLEVCQDFIINYAFRSHWVLNWLLKIDFLNVNLWTLTLRRAKRLVIIWRISVGFLYSIFNSFYLWRLKYVSSGDCSYKSINSMYLLTFRWNIHITLYRLDQWDSAKWSVTRKCLLGHFIIFCPRSLG